jgi:hypothetical protein
VTYVDIHAAVSLEGEIRGLVMISMPDTAPARARRLLLRSAQPRRR